MSGTAAAGAGAAVLVTGGGGFLGRHLAARLAGDASHPWRVRTLDRAFADEPGPGEERVTGSVTDGEVVAAAVEGCDAVVHLAALLPQRRRPPGEMRAVNAGGTRTVAAAAARAGVRRIVLCSSAEVYGVPRRVPMPEDGPLAPNGEYGRNKIAAEHAVRASGTEWVILRPPTIVGPGMPEPLLTGMLEAAARGRPVVVPGGGHRFQMIHVADMVDVIALVLTLPAAAGGVFNVGAENVPTGGELARAIRDALGSRSRVVTVPAWIARPAARLLDRFGRRLVEPEHLEIAFADYVLDTARARDVLGWRPRRTILEAFVDAAAPPHRSKPGAPDSGV